MGDWQSIRKRALRLVLGEMLSPGWRLAIFFALGLLVGLFVLLVRASRALSYLSDDPEVCINCHVMDNAYATWRHGSHAYVAKCVDCHLPHDNLVRKLAFKAMDGSRHSYVFTFRLEPQVLHLSEAAIPVIQANCIHCHQDQFQMIRLAGVSERRCWDCHKNIHGDVISLSGTPDARRPRLPSAGLTWFLKQSEVTGHE